MGVTRSKRKYFYRTAGTAGEDDAPLGPRTASLIRGGPHASDVYLQIMKRMNLGNVHFCAANMELHLKRQKTVCCRELYSLAERQGTLVAETSLSATDAQPPAPSRVPRWRAVSLLRERACANHDGDSARAHTTHPSSPLRTAYMTRTTAPHVARSHCLPP
jgi:hypothetical protein